MVQRTNAACGGRESVGVMKGEVVRSIRTGSTIARRPSDGAAFFVCGIISPFTAEGRSLVFGFGRRSFSRLPSQLHRRRNFPDLTFILPSFSWT